MGQGSGSNMRAIVCNELSQDISALSVEDRELPPPGKGEARLRLRAAAVGFPDILMVQGKYQHKPEVPFVPGSEAAGEVIALGEGAEGWAMGDRAMISHLCDCWATEMNAPIAGMRPIPDSVDFETAAAFTSAYLTAYVGLVRRGKLEPGQTLLVHGASGGVGLAAVEVGKLLGATVIATSASDEKLEVVKRKGADHVFNVKDGFRLGVKELTGGRGADVIFDPVGGDVFDESVRCIAWGGHLLVIGFASGRIPTIGANMPLIKGFSVVGVRAGEYGRRDPKKGAENIAAIDRWLAEGKVSPHVCKTFTLDRAVDAMRMIQNRTVVGRVVLAM